MDHTNIWYTRYSNAIIFAFLPKIMLGHKTKATKYGIAGHWLIKEVGDESKGEIVAPISGIRKGRCVLEVKNFNQSISKLFSVIL